MQRSLRIATFLYVVLLLVVPSAAQTNRGSISGTVTDATGAVVPGATVTVTNIGTNQISKLTTGAEGSFTLPSLEPVVYSITVEAPGFKKALINNIKVDTATAATINVSLETGAVETVVDITADTPLLNTDSGTAGQTITERQIQDVPLANRSVLDLAATLPNVLGDAGSENPEVTSGQPVPGFNLSLNGGRPGSTTFLADGVNNTGVGIARAVVSFTPETVQEFTVQTSAYDAQFGRTGGGVINVTTKSGSNSFNGVALLYHRNPATNARKWTTSTLRPPNNYRYTQGSLTLGGPVYLPRFGEGGKALYDGHNKTFFFVAYEPRWSKDFVVTDTLLPTDAMRAGDFSGLTRIANGWVPTAIKNQFPTVPVTSNVTTIHQQFNVVNGKYVPIVLGTGQIFAAFPNNRIPANMMDPTAVKALEYLPRAGNYFLNDAGQLSNFVVNRFVVQDETRLMVRLDHQLTEKNRLSGRFSRTPATGIRGFGSDINGNTGVYSNARQALITDTHMFSPTVINELRVNYSRGIFSEDFSPEYSIKNGKNLATELGIPSLTVGGMPLFNVSADGPNAFASIGSSGSTNNFNVEERYNISDIIYWNRSNMNWKLGVDLTHERLNVTPFFAASGGRWDFRVLNTSNNRTTNAAAGGNTWASYLIGVPNQVLARPVLIPYYYRWNSGAAFVQNDWKVKPNLTLNLGLRYSLQKPRTEKYDRQGIFRPDLAQTVELTTAQRRATAIGLGLLAANAPANAAIPTQVPTNVSIPAFAYAGRGGRSRYITPVEYTNFEPRFGFAWNPKGLGWLSTHHLVVRGGYGLSHVPINGNNRLPNPDFGAFATLGTNANGSSGAVDTTQPFRLSANAPVYSNVSFEQALNIPADGLVYDGSLAIPGFALSSNPHIPYTQNWNLTLSAEVMRNTVLEIAYVGIKGTRLYMPRVNINPRDLGFVEFLEGNNLNADSTFTDPLGRRALNGTALAITRGSVSSKYFGFSNLYTVFDSSANSQRHGMYISINRRVRQGLTLMANYNFGKSTDDASDASPDTRVLTNTTTPGHVTFGAPRELDHALSTYDIKHNFSATAVYDLPFGKTRRFGKTAFAPLQWVAGDWTVSSLFQLKGSTPIVPSLTDPNRLSNADQNRVVRPNVVAGVPLINPLWRRDCPVGTLCEPYVNPAAFTRPEKGELGNASRTMDVRGPMMRFFDLSLQKNFPIGEGKRRVQFRVDFLNVLNSPIFRWGNVFDLGSLPDETPMTTADYDAWIAADASRAGLARSTAAGAAMYTQVQNHIISKRLPTGALALDYYANVKLPQGFATTEANKFDITTLEGFKLYRFRRAYNTSFGTLRELQLPRYLQFGLKIYL